MLSKVWAGVAPTARAASGRGHRALCEKVTVPDYRMEWKFQFLSAGPVCQKGSCKVWIITQTIKCLSCKLEDLSSIPHLQKKSQAWWCELILLALGGGEGPIHEVPFGRSQASEQLCLRQRSTVSEGQYLRACFDPYRYIPRM